MLRSSVRLVSLLSPLTRSCRFMGRGRWNTTRKPTFIEFNERRQIVELDNMLKVGCLPPVIFPGDFYQFIVRKAKWRFRGDHLSQTGTIMPS